MGGTGTLLLSEKTPAERRLVFFRMIIFVFAIICIRQR
ncbi:hypothetical protein B4168_0770 [Anoxybacillus flavithermus]|nr:hypothetical protein B4168_0770 [Anoxybacillus flavithermus]OAO86778.1 hypothetical protein GT23_1796 [Parageobacillus thermoglucosidasius]